MAAPKGITSLSAYVASLRTSKHGEFAARAASRVAHEEAFADMKGHILGLYEKVEAAHSFQDETGAIFDSSRWGSNPRSVGSKRQYRKHPIFRRSKGTLRPARRRPAPTRTIGRMWRPAHRFGRVARTRTATSCNVPRERSRCAGSRSRT